MPEKSFPAGLCADAGQEALFRRFVTAVK